MASSKISMAGTPSPLGATTGVSLLGKSSEPQNTGTVLMIATMIFLLFLLFCGGYPPEKISKEKSLETIPYKSQMFPVKSLENIPICWCEVTTKNWVFFCVRWSPLESHGGSRHGWLEAAVCLKTRLWELSKSTRHFSCESAWWWLMVIFMFWITQKSESTLNVSSGDSKDSAVVFLIVDENPMCRRFADGTGPGSDGGDDKGGRQYGNHGKIRWFHGEHGK